MMNFIIFQTMAYFEFLKILLEELVYSHPFTWIIIISRRVFLSFDFSLLNFYVGIGMDIVENVWERISHLYSTCNNNPCSNFQQKGKHLNIVLVSTNK